MDAFPTVAFCSASIWASRCVGSSARPRIVRHLADRGWCTRRSWQLAFLANTNESGCRTFKAHGGEYVAGGLERRRSSAQVDVRLYPAFVATRSVAMKGSTVDHVIQADTAQRLSEFLLGH
jgi:hypothetical protein